MSLAVCKLRLLPLYILALELMVLFMITYCLIRMKILIPRNCCRGNGCCQYILCDICEQWDDKLWIYFLCIQRASGEEVAENEKKMDENQF